MKLTINVTHEAVRELICKHFGVPSSTEIVYDEPESVSVGHQTKEDDVWISNIGRDACYHPDSLAANTYIQVKYRTDSYGSYDTGDASEWTWEWKETDNHLIDIVAYRVLSKK